MLSQTSVFYARINLNVNYKFWFAMRWCDDEEQIKREIDGINSN